MLTETNKFSPPVILIVDDEVHCVGTLRSMLIRKFGEKISAIHSCNNVKSAREAVTELDPDLVFLDVEMPRETGFDLLKSLGKVNFEVIFTTAHEHYALKAIKFNALDYLLKPFSMQDLEKSMVRFWENKNDNNSSANPVMDVFLDNLNVKATPLKKMALPTMEGLVFVALQDIIRCEAHDNYTKFYFSDGKTQLVSRTLKKIEFQLEDMNFLRVHQSQLINIQHVAAYNRSMGGTIKMSDGATVEISRRMKADFIKRITEV